MKSLEEPIAEIIAGLRQLLDGYAAQGVEYHALLTRRAESLRSHAGQWALPGGRVDVGTGRSATCAASFGSANMPPRSMPRWMPPATPACAA